MSADDRRQKDSSGKEGAPGAAAIGGGAVTVLPAPPNARAAGLDARASGLAAFVAGETDVLAPGAQRHAHTSSVTVPVPVQILRASRARDARRRQVRRGVGAGVVFAAAGFVVWTAAIRAPATLSYTVDGAAPPPGGYVRSSPGHEPELAFSDGTKVRVLFRWDGEKLAPQTAIPPSAQRRAPAA